MRVFRAGERSASERGFPQKGFAAGEDTEIIPRVELRAPRRGWFRRRRNNHRVQVMRPSLVVMLGDALRAVGQRLALVGKLIATAAFIAATIFGGRLLVNHVVASPRFALREIRADATLHVATEDIVTLSGVSEGDQLLAVDPDAVASRVARHPWVAQVRVRRQLPSALVIEVVERRAVASVLLGTLYLIDDAGRPFKRATLDEADGLPVITGIARDQYTLAHAATEAAFREALGLLSAYHAADGLASRRVGAVERPALSEIHVDPRAGYSLVFFEGGGEVRLGRGDWTGKLARLDEILGAAGPRGPAALRAVFLDGPTQDRVTVRLTPPPAS